jgi:hypothetical protein
MLGMKWAADIWEIRVQLTKPVTWVPLIWGKSWVHVLYVIGGYRGVVWGRGWGRVWGGSAHASVLGVVCGSKM